MGKQKQFQPNASELELARVIAKAMQKLEQDDPGTLGRMAGEELERRKVDEQRKDKRPWWQKLLGR